MSETPRAYRSNTDPGDDDHEPNRWAAGVVAVTTAERAVIEAALAYMYEREKKPHDPTRSPRVFERFLDACRNLRLTRKLVDG